MEKPRARKTEAQHDWCADERLLDRFVAERWVRDVGEARFLSIAATAASQKRPSHRPKADYAPFVRQAVFLWLSDAEIELLDTAAIVARQVARSGNWESRPQITEPALRRALSVAIKNVTVAGVAAFEDEARRLELPVTRRWAVEQTRQAVRHQGSSESLTARQHAAPVDLRPRAERLALLIKSLQGVMSPDTPVSVILRLLDNLDRIFAP